MIEFWYINNLSYEEEKFLNSIGNKTALAIFGDFAVTVFEIKNKEEYLFLKLKFGERLQCIDQKNFI